MRRPLLAAGSVLVALAALFYVVSAVIGAVRHYSPVPVSDMWDGYVWFYLRASLGDSSVWTMSHSEHNLLLSRLFFWIDLRYFHGLSISLITLNLVLMAVLWAELLFAAWVLLRPRKELLFLTGALLLVPTFSWLQEENINCGFQIQFFEAFALPLAAFLCLARSLEGGRRRIWFLSSVLLGCVSMATMANGILALPLLIVMVCLSRQRVVARLLVLVPATAAVLAFYFLHRRVVPMETASWQEHLQFLLLFLGSPSANGLEGRGHVYLAGAVLLAGAAFAAWAWQRSTRRDPMFLALLVFLAYIVLSGLGAAHRRLFLGVEQALVGRYTTPALLGWSALSVLLVAHWRDARALPRTVRVLAVLLPIGFFPWQLVAFNSNASTQVRLKQLAALAADLGIRDHKRLRFLYDPDVRVLSLAAQAKQQNLSVFGLPEMIRARESLGRTTDALGLVECRGEFEEQRQVAEHPGVSAVSGWVFDRPADGAPFEVYFADERKLVIGVALSGRSRPAEGTGPERRASATHFDGYVREHAVGELKFFCLP